MFSLIAMLLSLVPCHDIQRRLMSCSDLACHVVASCHLVCRVVTSGYPVTSCEVAPGVVCLREKLIGGLIISIPDCLSFPERSGFFVSVLAQSQPESFDTVSRTSFCAVWKSSGSQCLHFGSDRSLRESSSGCTLCDVLLYGIILCVVLQAVL